MTGPPPDKTGFNSGSGEPGGNDLHWQIALDSINGVYKPATIMKDLDPIYFNGRYWISFSETGEHSGNRYFFYKLDFELPCFNLCGKSYNDDNAFCLSLDLYSDNSVFEVFVNGVAQSQNLGALIPLPNPYNPRGHTQSDRTTVQLCRNWKAGANSLLIQVASSATVAGLMVQASLVPLPPPDAVPVSVSICQGDQYNFDGQILTETGSYLKTFTKPNGCDSNVVLHLFVKPASRTTLFQSICEGESFLGYTEEGVYIDTLVAANGCDSIRTLNLDVNKKPSPDLGQSGVICEGDSVLLDPGEFSSYQWQDGSVSRQFVVKAPGIYSVNVSNGCGSATAEIRFTVGPCGIYFPTAFTPDNDGKNDFFRLLSHVHLEEFKLEVYNRLGQLVFETTDPSNGWNGSFKNKQQAAGTYVWKCRLSRSGEVSDLKGIVTLIR